MKITKRQLRGIIREEVDRALNEYGPGPMAPAGSRARGNQAPPSDSNWSNFATVMDIGILDLEEIGYELGFDSFADLDISIGPRSLAQRDPQGFVAAVKAHSLMAEDLPDEDILAAAQGY